jgi:hypothetical protein
MLSCAHPHILQMDRHGNAWPSQFEGVKDRAVCLFEGGREDGKGTQINDRILSWKEEIIKQEVDLRQFQSILYSTPSPARGFKGLSTRGSRNGCDSYSPDRRIGTAIETAIVLLDVHVHLSIHPDRAACVTSTLLLSLLSFCWFAGGCCIQFS